MFNKKLKERIKRLEYINNHLRDDILNLNKKFTSYYIREQIEKAFKNKQKELIISISSFQRCDFNDIVEEFFDKLKEIPTIEYGDNITGNKIIFKFK
jgi:hypothetical protein